MARDQKKKQNKQDSDVSESLSVRYRNINYQKGCLPEPYYGISLDILVIFSNLLIH